jgi:AraC-like DNA-binding protein
MTAYRNDVRLRLSLEAVLEGGDLSQIALESGFSSHSHFTAAFRAHFGVTPSTTRLPRRSLGEGGRLAPP